MPGGGGNGPVVTSGTGSGPFFTHQRRYSPLTQNGLPGGACSQSPSHADAGLVELIGTGADGPAVGTTTPGAGPPAGMITGYCWASVTPAQASKDVNAAKDPFRMRISSD